MNARFRKVWQWAWLLIGLPFAYATVLCSLIGFGPREAARWAKHCGLPWFRKGGAK